MKFTPRADGVLVEVLDAEEVTKGGIVLPDSAQEKPQEAKVVAVGKGKVSDDGKVITLETKVGDVVLFGKYSGSEIKIEGESYLMLKEDDILGYIG